VLYNDTQHTPDLSIDAVRTDGTVSVRAVAIFMHWSATTAAWWLTRALHTVGQWITRTYSTM